MFRVQYTEAANDALAGYWLTAPGALRREISQASHRIDQALQAGADTAGESREDPWRVLIDRPLGVSFRVEADGQTVTVARLWLIQ